jgi:hypothetical protein
LVEDVDRMKDLGTYVYCVVAAAQRPRLGRTRARLPGAGPIRLIDAGRSGRLTLWLVVADVPLDRYGEAAINSRLNDLDWVSRAAVAHESVVESFIDAAAAILPMKLFTIFTDDDRALQNIHEQRTRVAATVKRVMNHLEWGVRVMLVRAAPAAPAAARAVSGAGYLAGKKAQRDATSELGTRAREAMAALFEELSKVAADARRRAASDLPLEGGPLLLDAAFLVPKSRQKRFAATVSRWARLLKRSGYGVILTGPWPPYSFMRE